MGYSSPAALFVFLTSQPEKIAIIIVKDNTDKAEVREFQRQRTRDQKIIIVHRITNLPKLGAKPRPSIGVVVCDAPELLLSLRRAIRTIDVKEDKNTGKTSVRRAKIPEIMEAVGRSGYGTPISGKRIRRIMSSFVAVVPTTADKSIKATDLIDYLIDNVKDVAKDRVRQSLFEFMAGILSRHKMSGTRKWAMNRAAPGVDIGKYKKAFADFQCWAEDENGGRKVAAAYQSTSGKKVKPAIAAGRFDADVNILMRLFKEIPPSARTEYPGWEYKAKPGD